MSDKLKLRWKTVEKPKLHCKLCGEDGHEQSTCAALTWCHRCGEKGHFPQVCPHHTEASDDKKERRREEKKNWEVQLTLSEKAHRTEGEWGRGRSVTPDTDDDIPCPIPAVLKPFTEEERERAAARRKWFADRDARKKRKQQEREAAEAAEAAARAAHESRKRSPSPEAKRQKREDSDRKPPRKVPSPEPRRRKSRSASTSSSSSSSSNSSDSATAKQKGNPPRVNKQESGGDVESQLRQRVAELEQQVADLQRQLRAARGEPEPAASNGTEEPKKAMGPPPSKESKQPQSQPKKKPDEKEPPPSAAYLAKVRTQREFFECPTWAGIPDRGSELRIEVRRDGQKVQEMRLDRSPYYLFGKVGDVCDFELEHPSISRVHFATAYNRKERQLYVYDLGSKLGTFLDGTRLPAKEFVPFKEGATLTAGNSKRSYILRHRSQWDE
eukprot:TRINITY_DN3445_c0_g2_i1.p1 TRINITY_DN3445_c0_g2~~TRINITY_DN3445_c0_g2_i1.p1  ORF type:complete len:448 (+),score=87.02 TRINITY_DN3445_c0_g2_i1:22-1344(+)